MTFVSVGSPSCISTFELRRTRTADLGKESAEQGTVPQSCDDIAEIIELVKDLGDEMTESSSA